MIAQIVRFKSTLSDEEVLKTYRARAGCYRALKGLRQKYYLSFPTTGEHGAVYLWESEEALNEFHESDLAHTIAKAYRIQGKVEMQTAEVVMTLHPSLEPVAPSPDRRRRDESR